MNEPEMPSGLPAPTAAPAPSPAARPRSVTGVAGIVLGAIAIVIVLIAVLVSIVGFAAHSEGLMMVSALAVVPLATALAAVAGIAAVVLAIVCGARTRWQDRRWIVALVLGVVGAFAPPITLGILFAAR